MTFHRFPATELNRAHHLGARGMLAQLCSAAHGQPGPSAYEVFLAFAIPFVSSSHVYGRRPCRPRIQLRARLISRVSVVRGSLATRRVGT